jgi:hypothetical protein
LTVLERRDDVVRSVEHLRRRRRLNDGLDRVEAGRADLGADVGVRDLCERRGIGDGRVLQRDDCLLGLVVRRGEVDGLGALRGDRDLVDVEVVVLLARSVRAVERLDDPLDLVLGKAELLGDRVGDRGLEALPVGRVVVLEVGREGRIVGRDGERVRRDRIELVGSAVFGLDFSCLLGRLRRIVVIVAAAGGDHSKGGD